MPDSVHYVFLSATIPNARQFAEWICHLHHQVWLAYSLVTCSKSILMPEIFPVFLCITRCVLKNWYFTCAIFKYICDLCMWARKRDRVHIQIDPYLGTGRRRPCGRDYINFPNTLQNTTYSLNDIEINKILILILQKWNISASESNLVF